MVTHGRGNGLASGKYWDRISHAVVLVSTADVNMARPSVPIKDNAQKKKLDK